jgi:hypothetical protein
LDTDFTDSKEFQNDCTAKSRNATTEDTENTELRRRENREFRRKCSAILLFLISVFSVPSVVKLLFAVESQMPRIQRIYQICEGGALWLRYGSRI